MKKEFHQYMTDKFLSGSQQITIVDDFETFTEYFRNTETQLTTNHQLPHDILSSLNQKLKGKLDYIQSRPAYKMFPNIQGLYLLLRCTGMGKISYKKKEVYLYIDDEIYQQWRGLNPIEKYLNLLIYFLGNGKAEILDEKEIYLSHELYDFIINTLARPLKAHHLQTALSQYMDYKLRLYNLFLIESFGFLKVEKQYAQNKSSWEIESIESTDLGTTFAYYLHSFDKSLIFFINNEALFSIDNGKVVGNLQFLVPDFETVLRQNDKTAIKGTYTFLINLRKRSRFEWSPEPCSRKIIIPGDYSVEAFCSFVLDAFNFSRDSLYMLERSNDFGIKERYSHPMAPADNGNLRANKNKIKDIGIKVYETIDFLYNMGENWKFEIICTKIDKEEAISIATIIDKTGTPPDSNIQKKE